MAENDFLERIKHKAKEKDTRTKEYILKCIKEQGLDKYIRFFEGKDVMQEYTVSVEKKKMEDNEKKLIEYYKVIARGAKCAIKGESIFFDEDKAYRYALYKLKYLEEIFQETYTQR
jgi:hypothetical protein